MSRAQHNAWQKVGTTLLGDLSPWASGLWVSALSSPPLGFCPGLQFYPLYSPTGILRASGPPRQHGDSTAFAIYVKEPDTQ